jgi:hypothetical protein
MKKIATTVYITEDQQQLLKELNRRTRVPIAEFIREGIDLVLEKHAAQLPGQMGLQVKSDSPNTSVSLIRNNTNSVPNETNS